MNKKRVIHSFLLLAAALASCSPLERSLATRPLIQASTDMPEPTTSPVRLPELTSTSAIAAISAPTLASSPTAAPSPTPTETPAPTLSQTSTSTPVTVPVSEAMLRFFSFYVPTQGNIWSVQLKLLKVYYEMDAGRNLNLRLDIQCTPRTSPCEWWVYRTVFANCFVDPQPDPVKMAMFPDTLTGFQILGFDQDMKQVENVAGKWSDLAAYEQRQISWDEWMNRMVEK